MRAVTYQGTKDIQVRTMPDPQIINPRDAIVRVTLAAICGSDLHLYHGWNPTVKKDDILGHEFMGEVVEAGPGVKNLRPGQKVVVPFDIACGQCFMCKQGLFSVCENSNCNGWMQEKVMGYPTAGLYGYSHLMGGYAGGQAQYVRVLYADTNAVPVVNGLTDEQALFVGDILSTGYMAAENAGIRAGDTVAVWGCGPVGLLAMQCAYFLGAERVIAIDRFDYRLRLAESKVRAQPINYKKTDVLEALKELTGGRGPDACIEAVGMDAHGTGLVGAYDHVKQVLRLETDRPNALREAIMACRAGGTVSIPGVYTGFIDKFPMGVAMNRGLTFKMGQTHTQRYMRKLLDAIAQGKIDPTFIITHRLPLEEAPQGFETFNDKQEDCVKVVLRP